MTVIVWGGLYLYGVLALHGVGSLFDTNPEAANIFFCAWFVLTAVAAIAGGYISRAPKK